MPPPSKSVAPPPASVARSAATPAVSYSLDTSTARAAADKAAAARKAAADKAKADQAAADKLAADRAKADRAAADRAAAVRQAAADKAKAEKAEAAKQAAAEKAKADKLAAEKAAADKLAAKKEKDAIHYSKETSLPEELWSTPDGPVALTYDKNAPDSKQTLPPLPDWIKDPTTAAVPTTGGTSAEEKKAEPKTQAKSTFVTSQNNAQVRIKNYEWEIEKAKADIIHWSNEARVYSKYPNGAYRAAQALKTVEACKNDIRRFQAKITELSSVASGSGKSRGATKSETTAPGKAAQPPDQRGLNLKYAQLKSAINNGVSVAGLKELARGMGWEMQKIPQDNLPEEMTKELNSYLQALEEKKKQLKTEIAESCLKLIRLRGRLQEEEDNAMIKIGETAAIWPIPQPIDIAGAIAGIWFPPIGIAAAINAQIRNSKDSLKAGYELLEFTEINAIARAFDGEARALNSTIKGMKDIDDRQKIIRSLMQ